MNDDLFTGTDLFASSLTEAGTNIFSPSMDTAGDEEEKKKKKKKKEEEELLDRNFFSGLYQGTNKYAGFASLLADYAIRGVDKQKREEFYKRFEQNPLGTFLEYPLSTLGAIFSRVDDDSPSKQSIKNLSYLLSGPARGMDIVGQFIAPMSTKRAATEATRPTKPAEDWTQDVAYTTGQLIPDVLFGIVATIGTAGAWAPALGGIRLPSILGGNLAVATGAATAGAGVQLASDLQQMESGAREDMGFAELAGRGIISGLANVIGAGSIPRSIGYTYEELLQAAGRRAGIAEAGVPLLTGSTRSSFGSALNRLSMRLDNMLMGGEYMSPSAWTWTARGIERAIPKSQWWLRNIALDAVAGAIGGGSTEAYSSLFHDNITAGDIATSAALGSLLTAGIGAGLRGLESLGGLSMRSRRGAGDMGVGEDVTTPPYAESARAELPPGRGWTPPPTSTGGGPIVPYGQGAAAMAAVSGGGFAPYVPVSGRFLPSVPEQAGGGKVSPAEPTIEPTIGGGDKTTQTPQPDIYARIEAERAQRAQELQEAARVRLKEYDERLQNVARLFEKLDARGGELATLDDVANRLRDTGDLPLTNPKNGETFSVRADDLFRIGEKIGEEPAKVAAKILHKYTLPDSVYLNLFSPDLREGDIDIMQLPTLVQRQKEFARKLAESYGIGQSETLKEIAMTAQKDSDLPSAFGERGYKSSEFSELEKRNVTQLPVKVGDTITRVPIQLFRNDGIYGDIDFDTYLKKLSPYKGIDQLIREHNVTNPEQSINALMQSNLLPGTATIAFKDAGDYTIDIRQTASDLGVGTPRVLAALARLEREGRRSKKYSVRLYGDNAPEAIRLGLDKAIIGKNGKYTLVLKPKEWSSYKWGEEDERVVNYLRAMAKVAAGKLDDEAGMAYYESLPDVLKFNNISLPKQLLARRYRLIARAPIKGDWEEIDDKTRIGLGKLILKARSGDIKSKSLLNSIVREALEDYHLHNIGTTASSEEAPSDIVAIGLATNFAIDLERLPANVDPNRREAAGRTFAEEMMDPAMKVGSVTEYLEASLLHLIDEEGIDADLLDAYKKITNTIRSGYSLREIVENDEIWHEFVRDAEKLARLSGENSVMLEGLLRYIAQHRNEIIAVIAGMPGDTDGIDEGDMYEISENMADAISSARKGLRQVVNDIEYLHGVSLFLSRATQIQAQNREEFVRQFLSRVFYAHHAMLFDAYSRMASVNIDAEFLEAYYTDFFGKTNDEDFVEKMRSVYSKFLLSSFGRQPEGVAAATQGRVTMAQVLATLMDSIMEDRSDKPTMKKLFSRNWEQFADKYIQSWGEYADLMGMHHSIVSSYMMLRRGIERIVYPYSKAVGNLDWATDLRRVAMEEALQLRHEEAIIDEMLGVTSVGGYPFLKKHILQIGENIFVKPYIGSAQSGEVATPKKETIAEAQASVEEEEEPSLRQLLNLLPTTEQAATTGSHVEETKATGGRLDDYITSRGYHATLSVDFSASGASNVREFYYHQLLRAGYEQAEAERLAGEIIDEFPRYAQPGIKSLIEAIPESVRNSVYSSYYYDVLSSAYALASIDDAKAAELLSAVQRVHDQVYRDIESGYYRITEWSPVAVAYRLFERSLGSNTPLQRVIDGVMYFDAVNAYSYGWQQMLDSIDAFFPKVFMFYDPAWVWFAHDVVLSRSNLWNLVQDFSESGRIDARFSGKVSELIGGGVAFPKRGVLLIRPSHWWEDMMTYALPSMVKDDPLAYSRLMQATYGGEADYISGSLVYTGEVRIGVLPYEVFGGSRTIYMPLESWVDHAEKGGGFVLGVTYDISSVFGDMVRLYEQEPKGRRAAWLRAFGFERLQGNADIVDAVSSYLTRSLERLKSEYNVDVIFSGNRILVFHKDEVYDEAGSEDVARELGEVDRLIEQILAKVSLVGYSKQSGVYRRAVIEPDEEYIGLVEQLHRQATDHYRSFAQAQTQGEVAQYQKRGITVTYFGEDIGSNPTFIELASKLWEKRAEVYRELGIDARMFDMGKDDFISNVRRSVGKLLLYNAVRGNAFETLMRTQARFNSIRRALQISDRDPSIFYQPIVSLLGSLLGGREALKDMPEAEKYYADFLRLNIVWQPIASYWKPLLNEIGTFDRETGEYRFTRIEQLERGVTAHLIERAQMFGGIDNIEDVDTDENILTDYRMATIAGGRNRVYVRRAVSNSESIPEQYRGILRSLEMLLQLTHIEYTMLLGKSYYEMDKLRRELGFVEYIVGSYSPEIAHHLVSILPIYYEVHKDGDGLKLMGIDDFSRLIAGNVDPERHDFYIKKLRDFYPSMVFRHGESKAPVVYTELYSRWADELGMSPGERVKFVNRAIDAVLRLHQEEERFEISYIDYTKVGTYNEVEHLIEERRNPYYDFRLRIIERLKNMRPFVEELARKEPHLVEWAHQDPNIDQFLSRFQLVYHGTWQDDFDRFDETFSVLERHNRSYIDIDCLLGYHFAEDFPLSQEFAHTEPDKAAKMLTTGKLPGSYEAGRLFAAYVNPEAKVYDITKSVLFRKIGNTEWLFGQNVNINAWVLFGMLDLVGGPWGEQITINDRQNAVLNARHMIDDFIASVPSESWTIDVEEREQLINNFLNLWDRILEFIQNMEPIQSDIGGSMLPRGNESYLETYADIVKLSSLISQLKEAWGDLFSGLETGVRPPGQLYRDVYLKHGYRIVRYADSGFAEVDYTINYHALIALDPYAIVLEDDLRAFYAIVRGEYESAPETEMGVYSDNSNIDTIEGLSAGALLKLLYGAADIVAEIRERKTLRERFSGIDLGELNFISFQRAPFGNVVGYTKFNREIYVVSPYEGNSYYYAVQDEEDYRYYSIYKSNGEYLITVPDDKVMNYINWHASAKNWRFILTDKNYAGHWNVSGNIFEYGLLKQYLIQYGRAVERFKQAEESGVELSDEEIKESIRASKKVDEKVIGELLGRYRVSDFMKDLYGLNIKYRFAILRGIEGDLRRKYWFGKIMKVDYKKLSYTFPDIWYNVERNLYPEIPEHLEPLLSDTARYALQWLRNFEKTGLSVIQDIQEWKEDIASAIRFYPTFLYENSPVEDYERLYILLARTYRQYYESRGYQIEARRTVPIYKIKFGDENVSIIDARWGTFTELLPYDKFYEPVARKLLEQEYAKLSYEERLKIAERFKERYNLILEKVEENGIFPIAIRDLWERYMRRRFEEFLIGPPRHILLNYNTRRAYREATNIVEKVMSELEGREEPYKDWDDLLVSNRKELESFYSRVMGTSDDVTVSNYSRYEFLYNIISRIGDVLSYTDRAEQLAHLRQYLSYLNKLLSFVDLDRREYYLIDDFGSEGGLRTDEAKIQKIVGGTIDLQDRLDEFHKLALGVKIEDNPAWYYENLVRSWVESAGGGGGKGVPPKDISAGDIGSERAKGEEGGKGSKRSGSGGNIPPDLGFIYSSIFPIPPWVWRNPQLSSVIGAMLLELLANQIDDDDEVLGLRGKTVKYWMHLMSMGLVGYAGGRYLYRKIRNRVIDGTALDVAVTLAESYNAEHIADIIAKSSGGRSSGLMEKIAALRILGAGATKEEVEAMAKKLSKVNLTGGTLLGTMATSNPLARDLRDAFVQIDVVTKSINAMARQSSEMWLGRASDQDKKSLQFLKERYDLSWKPMGKWYDRSAAWKAREMMPIDWRGYLPLAEYDNAVGELRNRGIELPKYRELSQREIAQLARIAYKIDYDLTEDINLMRRQGANEAQIELELIANDNLIFDKYFAGDNAYLYPYYRAMRMSHDLVSDIYFKTHAIMVAGGGARIIDVMKYGETIGSLRDTIAEYDDRIKSLELLVAGYPSGSDMARTYMLELKQAQRERDILRERLDRALRIASFSDMSRRRHYLSRWHMANGRFAIRVKLSDTDPGELRFFDSRKEAEDFIAQNMSMASDIMEVDPSKIGHIIGGDENIELKPKGEAERYDILGHRLNAIFRYNELVSSVDTRSINSLADYDRFAEVFSEVADVLASGGIVGKFYQTLIRDIRQRADVLLNEIREGLATGQDVKPLRDEFVGLYKTLVRLADDGFAAYSTYRGVDNFLERRNVRGYTESLKSDADWAKLLVGSEGYLEERARRVIENVSKRNMILAQLKFLNKYNIGEKYAKKLREALIKREGIRYNIETDAKWIWKATELGRLFLLAKALGYSISSSLKNLTYAVVQGSAELMRYRLVEERVGGVTDFVTAPMKIIRYLVMPARGELKKIDDYMIRNGLYRGEFYSSQLERLVRVAGERIAETALLFQGLAEAWANRAVMLSAASDYLSRHPGDYAGAVSAALRQKWMSQGKVAKEFASFLESRLHDFPIVSMVTSLFITPLRILDIQYGWLKDFLSKPGIRNAAPLLALMLFSVLVGGIQSLPLLGDAYKLMVMIASMLGDTSTTESPLVDESPDEFVRRKFGEWANAMGMEPKAGWMLYDILNRGVISFILGRNYQSYNTFTDMMEPILFSTIDEFVRVFKKVASDNGVTDEEAAMLMARLLNTMLGRFVRTSIELEKGTFVDSRGRPLGGEYGYDDAFAELLLGRPLEKVQAGERDRYGGGTIYTTGDAYEFAKRLRNLSGLMLPVRVLERVERDPAYAEEIRQRLIAKYYGSGYYRKSRDLKAELHERIEKEGNILDKLTGITGIEFSSRSAEYQRLLTSIDSKIERYYIGLAVADMMRDLGEISFYRGYQQQNEQFDKMVRMEVDRYVQEKLSGSVKKRRSKEEDLFGTDKKRDIFNDGEGSREGGIFGRKRKRDGIFGN